jgi:hypothetical protein
MVGSPQNEKRQLSRYTRWLLHIYGPEILDRLGSFGFLLHELVPLQLISSRRLGG